MLTPDSIAQRFKAVPPRPLAGTLVRLVPFLDLAQYEPVDWLYASGKPNRYNPAGVECLYCATDEPTARAEYDDSWSGLPGGKQPFVTYYIKARLRHVLDLTSATNLQKIGLKKSDLLVPWRGVRTPTLTQVIGQIVNQDIRFSAIQYASRAAKDAGFDGINLVIFQDCIKRPDFVHILGPTSKILQKWP